MGSSLSLNGIYVPLVTPFASDGEVAVDALEVIARHYLEAGAAGLVALGTTGEPATLDAPERRSVIETVAKVCTDANATLVVGAGSNSTRAAVAAVDELADLDGLDAVLSVVPYYTRPSEAGIVAHFQTIARHSSKPLILYNIPYRTGRGLGAQSLLELATDPNIAGLKQAVGGIDQDTLTLLANKPDDFYVLGGDDPFIFPLLALGGSGAIAASAHVCTRGFVRLVEAAAKGELGEARRLAACLLPVCQALFVEPSPSVLKGVLSAQGLIPTPVLRAPMTGASAASVDAAFAAVELAERRLGD